MKNIASALKPHRKPVGDITESNPIRSADSVKSTLGGEDESRSGTRPSQPKDSSEYLGTKPRTRDQVTSNAIHSGSLTNIILACYNILLIDFIMSILNIITSTLIIC